MKLFLFIAKAYALRLGSKELTLPHLVEALHLVDFCDEKSKTIFEDATQQFEKSIQQPADSLSYQHLLKAAIVKLPLSADVRHLLMALGGIEHAVTQLKADKISDYQASLNQLLMVQQQSPPDPVVETQNDDQNAASKPAKLLTVSQLQRLKQGLSAELVGQDEAIDALYQSLLHSVVMPTPNKPLASFFFLGSTATGKSMLASRLVKHLGPDWHEFIIPMSSMVVHSQSSLLDGTEPSYHNASPGQLTDFVRRNPKTVVVFEDIDKAHPAVIARLNSILAQGMMRDQFGFYQNNDPGQKQLAPAEVDFQQTIVIFTSNALEDLYTSSVFNTIEQQGRRKVQATLLDALNELESGITNARVFGSGLLRLLGSESIVLFKQLNFSHFLHIAKATLHKTTACITEQFGCSIELQQPDALLTLKVLALFPDIDARQIAAQLSEQWLQPVVEYDVQQRQLNQVQWQLSGHVEQQLNEFLAKADSNDIAAWLRRKGIVISIEQQRSYAENVLLINITGFTTSRVVQNSDLKGLGAIRIEVPSVKFDDIVGHHLVKSRLSETIRLLQNPQQIKSHKVALPKGLLLYGPPGTGKTLLAKALAHEADLPFISVSGTDLLQLEFVKALFARARKYAPAVLFIDEIDVLGSREGRGYNVIINQLLTEIDGFATDLVAPVFIIAATNRPQDLDPALVRAGRIDIHIRVPTLDRDARRYFIQKYFDLPHDGSLEETSLLNLTSGMSGAELEQIRREVLLEMIRQNLPTISHAMLLEFINQRKYGHRATVKRTLDDLTATAYHEAGHAIVSHVLNPESVIEQISIASRGDMAGFVAFNREASLYKRMTRMEVLEEIAVLLAGRCAESIKFGPDSVCAGASSDLLRASTIALHAITLSGLDDEIGLLSVGNFTAELQQALNAQVLNRVQIWLKDAESLCFSTLHKHWHSVEQVVALLLEQDVLDGAVLNSLVDSAQ